MADKNEFFVQFGEDGANSLISKFGQLNKMLQTTTKNLNKFRSDSDKIPANIRAINKQLKEYGKQDSSKVAFASAKLARENIFDYQKLQDKDYQSVSAISKQLSALQSVNDYVARTNALLNNEDVLSKQITAQEDLKLEKVRALAKYYEENRDEIIAANLELKKQKDAVNEIVNAGKKQSGLSKLWNTFKRIGFYRIARATFSIIKNMISEGVSGFAKFDEQSNKTMSSLTSSFTMIKASIGAAFAPLLDIVEPLFRQMAIGFANVANAISKASAQMKGLSTYTKINTDYMKKYGEEAKSSLLSFDKFETLSGEQDNDLYQTADIIEETSELDSFAESLVDTFSQLGELLQEIVELIKVLWDLLKPVFQWIWSQIKPALESTISFIKAISKLLRGDFKGALEDIKNTFKNMGKLIVNTFAPIGKIIGNALLGLVNLFISAVEGMLNAVIDAINKVLKPIKSVLNFIGVKFDGIPKQSFKRINYLADGGIMENVGSLYVAGESGAELVHNMPSGQTGVTNVKQFKQAMVEAFYECADLFAQEQPDVVLNLDGATIARSRRFKNELNRTNAGLNLI